MSGWPAEDGSLEAEQGEEECAPAAFPLHFARMVQTPRCWSWVSEWKQ